MSDIGSTFRLRLPTNSHFSKAFLRSHSSSHVLLETTSYCDYLVNPRDCLVLQALCVISVIPHNLQRCALVIRGGNFSLFTRKSGDRTCVLRWGVLFRVVQCASALTDTPLCVREEECISTYLMTDEARTTAHCGRFLRS